jgi:hypothetical protein
MLGCAIAHPVNPRVIKPWRSRPWVLACGALASACAAYAFRWLAAGQLTNDHFVNVARAQQMLRGELPVRDFVDPGLPLMYAVSAAAAWLMPHPLYAETVLVASALAVAAGISFVTAAIVARSLSAATLAVLLQIALFPRTYSYPKYLLYAVAIATGLWAVQRLNGRRTLALAAVTALGYYFRHDHGLYIAGGVVLLLIVEARTRAWRPLLLYIALTASLIAPHLLFVQRTVGLSSYLEVASDLSRREAVSRFVVPAFTSPVASAENAPAAVFWLFWLIPAAAGLLLVTGRGVRRRGGPLAAADGESTLPPAAAITMMVALAAALNVGFIGEPFPVRLPDVGVPQTILGAWVAATLWRLRLPPFMLVLRGVVAAGTLLLAMSIWRLSDMPFHLTQSHLLEGPSAIRQNWRFIDTALRSELNGARSPLHTLAPLFVYIRQCTEDDDRLLYAAYDPAAYVLAQRGFAGGHVIFWRGFHSAPAEQTLTVQRLRRQHVAFVLIPASRRVDFENDYPMVWAYLAPRFTPVTRQPLPDGDQVDVLIDRTRPVRRSYGPEGWPCLTP